MADNETMDLLNLLRKRLDGAEPDVLRDMVQLMAEGLMSAEADKRQQAPRHSEELRRQGLSARWSAAG